MEESGNALKAKLARSIKASNDVNGKHTQDNGIHTEGDASTDALDASVLSWLLQHWLAGSDWYHWYSGFPQKAASIPYLPSTW